LFYTIYKTTNIINGKHYIGKHQTKDLDDGYFGSGKLLKRAIKKYGIDNFVKQILRVCTTEKEMDLIEKILVVPDPEISYNLCNGGQGGWSYLNREYWSKEKRIKNNKKAGTKSGISRKNRMNTDIEFRNSYIKSSQNRLLAARKIKYPQGTFKNKTHTTEWKLNHSSVMKNKLTGNKNGSFGTCWITNGQENKKIKKNELDTWLEKGYHKGRI
jgi:hypothetical protein